MTKPKDDLEAVRGIADILESFSDEERERIIRWARERLGMGVTQPQSQPQPTPGQPPQPPYAPTPTPNPPASDIRSFIDQKDPKNDKQLAAVVAYFHQFVAPEDQKKDSITSADLIDACRQADRRRPGRPAQTLGNAYNDGLLDRGEHGHYSLNSVGENLVSMVLPEQPGDPGARRTTARRPGRRKATRRPTKAKKKAKAKKKTNKKKAKRKTRKKKAS